MSLRGRAVAQPLGKARELEMHGTGFLEGQARLEEAARLAPQFCLHAQPAKRGEELGIAVVLGEPVLGAFDANVRFVGSFGRAQVLGQRSVERDQARAPIGGERVFEDLARERRETECGGMARGGGGNARMYLV